MALAMAKAVACLSMRGGADLHENLLFMKQKHRFRPMLVISGPSRSQKWILARNVTLENGIGRSGNLKLVHFVTIL